MQAALVWLLKLILEWLVTEAWRRAKSELDKIEQDRQRGVTNEENVRRYEEAYSRAQRIAAANDLLNRTRRP